ncbi:TrbC/VirB2 family protein [Erythrobacter sp. GH1-10]|uniref:TrbC/VirB2 family protein n=1 Tax=Erythrobacter sp. GH1-10 TaxID=3349334 RepID=UPI00387801A2
MAAPVQSSLLEPAGPSELGGSLDWINGLLLGELALTLCVLAVAFVGFLMLSGRLAVREGLRVALGCFVLLGAPTIAVAISGAFERSESVDPTIVEAPSPSPRGDLESAEYNPYAQASVRDDR